jgi:hypothetical protein
LFHNSNYLVHVLFTFYIQSVLKIKKNNSGAKRLRYREVLLDGSTVLYLKRNALYWLGDGTLVSAVMNLRVP